MKKKLSILTICLAFVLLLLAGCGGGWKEEAPAADSAPAAELYRVIVKDEAGKPVPVVMVQICSDKACQMGETNDEGIADYPDTPEGVYTVHVYSVPEGYAEDSTEYPVPETFGDVNITLKAK